MAAENSTLASVIVAGSNQSAVRVLAKLIASRPPAGHPFCRRVVLVDHRAIGTNLIAEMAATTGLVVAVFPTTIQEFIGSMTAAVEKALSTASPPAPPNPPKPKTAPYADPLPPDPPVSAVIETPALTFIPPIPPPPPSD